MAQRLATGAILSAPKVDRSESIYSCDTETDSRMGSWNGRLAATIIKLRIGNKVIRIVDCQPPPLAAKAAPPPPPCYTTHTKNLILSLPGLTKNYCETLVSNCALLFPTFPQAKGTCNMDRYVFPCTKAVTTVPTNQKWVQLQVCACTHTNQYRFPSICFLQHPTSNGSDVAGQPIVFGPYTRPTYLVGINRGGTMCSLGLSFATLTMDTRTMMIRVRVPQPAKVILAFAAAVTGTWPSSCTGLLFACRMLRNMTTPCSLKSLVYLSSRVGPASLRGAPCAPPSHADPILTAKLGMCTQCPCHQDR